MGCGQPPRCSLAPSRLKNSAVAGQLSALSPKIPFAESRVGFHFKDTEEFGLYGFFAGNDDDVYHSYYRTDRTFQKEEMLLTNDED